MASDAPYKGALVHFVSGDVHLAALVTDPDWQWPGEPNAPDEAVNPLLVQPRAQALLVLPPMQAPFWVIAFYDEHMATMTWHWPEQIAPHVEPYTEEV